MLFVKITEECREDAKRHGIEKKLEDFAKEIVQKQNDNNFDKSPKPFMVRRNFGGRAGRLIGHKLFAKIDGEDHAVIILLSYMIYDADGYAQKINGDPQGYFNREYKAEMERFHKEEISGFIKGELAQSSVVSGKNRIIIGDSLSKFLSSPVSQGTDRSEDIISESSNWIDAVFSSDIENLLPRVRDALELIHGVGDEGDGEVLKYPVPQSGNKSDSVKSEYFVYYQWIVEHRKDIDGHKYTEKTLYVCDVGREGIKPKGVIPKNELNRAKEYYFRAYPSYMLGDDKLWIRQEKERYGNFALSKEESEVLNIPEGEPNVPFPLFVNGRAGSGKSTVLQYLYAEYFVRYNKLEDDEYLPPAYFACSAELLERAKDVVGGILRNNPAYQIEEAEWNTLVKPQDGEETSFTRSFRVYRDYLLSLIPPGEQGRFIKATENARERSAVTDSSHIDYAKFLQLWNLKFSDRDRKVFGPDLSWHLIRTYIKGWSASGFISTADDLATMLLSEKGNEELVESGVYKEIFTKVWLGWYKDLTAPESGIPEYWDDQDLVRFILDKEYLQVAGKKFVGIFCDEAQDFTRIELKSLLGMTVYSDKIIEEYQLKSLPFVFAGDEFQTLNPTGFRWDVMRTSFVETLLEGLCPTARTTEINFKDLTHNYRSKYNIVKLGNAVQLNRAIAFGLKGLRPQKPWRKSAANAGKPVFYFNEDVDDLWAAFQEMDADKAIVLPCLEKQEDEYLKAHPQLKKYVEERPDGTTNPPVFSVVSAKGLDFDIVLAYGFGEAFPDNLPEENTKNISAKMALGYFLNRLYVAVTRPKEQLLIVDGKDGYDRLWRSYISIDDLLEKYRQTFGDECQFDAWRENIGVGLNDKKESSEPLVIWENDGGDNNARTCLSSDYKYDPLGTARKYETSGMRERSPKLMMYAARWFRRCKDDIEKHNRDADNCEAFANLFSDKRKEAAVLFAKINDYKRACECWWSLSPFDCDSLAKAPVEALEVYPHPFRFEVARACSDGGTLSAEVRVLKKMVDGVDVGGEDLSSPEWGRIIRDVVKRILKDESFDESSAQVLCEAAEKRLYKAQPSSFRRLVERKLYAYAEKIYSIERFNQQEINPEDYRKMCFYTKGMPTMLEYSPEKRGEAENRYIVDKYHGDFHGVSKLIDDGGRKIVIDAYASTVGLEEMWYELRQIKDVQLLRELADRIGGKEARKALFQAAVIAKYESLRHGEALNSIVDEGQELISRYGEKFVVRLLARIALAPASGEQPNWPKIRSFIDVNRLLDPGQYTFSEELPEEEFVVAFTKYSNNMKSRFPQFYDATHAKDLSWSRVDYSWDSLRNDIVTKDRLSVDSTYKYGPKEYHNVIDHEKETVAKQERSCPMDTETSTARPVSGSAGSVKMTINFGSFKAVYYKRAQKLEFEVVQEDDMHKWSVGPEGLEIDYELHGYKELKPVPGSPYLLSSRNDAVELKDTDSGDSTIIKFS